MATFRAMVGGASLKFGGDRAGRATVGGGITRRVMATFRAMVGGASLKFEGDRAGRATGVGEGSLGE
jgi:hypothetical protein